MTFNSNKINLPRIVMINLRDKIKIRWMIKGEPLLFHVMLKQGITWFHIGFQHSRNCITQYKILFSDGLCSYATM